MDENRDVALVMFQYGVAVGGIEKKLEDMGYRVILIGDNLEEEIKLAAGFARLFVIYLSDDILRDQKKYDLFTGMVDLLVEKKQRAVIVGERRCHEEMLEKIPVLASYPWLYRPVDMKAFETEIKKVTSSLMTIRKAKKKRVLIFDEDLAFAGLLLELIRLKYRADAVTDPVSAISFLKRILEDDRVDLILLGYDMSVMSAEQFFLRLKDDPDIYEIPVAFIADGGSKEIKDDVLRLKAKGYLLRSAESDEISEFLDELLGERKK